MKSIPVWVRTFPPGESEGWTIHCIERESRYWVEARAGRKEKELFEAGTAAAWGWAKSAVFIRWFTDGERRYGLALWKLASVWLKPAEISANYPHRKVWRFGLEVAMKVKGSQGRRRIVWVKSEHPYTAMSPANEVHANHNEAQNSAIRRRASAYRRRQNLYAKTVDALQRVLDVQRLLHNWVRPHWSLGGNTTPAMAMGYCVGEASPLENRPISTHELPTTQGLHSITS